MDSALGYQIFRWVKYLTYALLSLNIWLFLAEEIDSARFAIASGEDVVMGVQLFSATPQSNQETPSRSLLYTACAHRECQTEGSLLSGRQE